MNSSGTKTKKGKGPLRLEAILPLTVVLVLFIAYFKYFFDSHLKRGIEFASTYVNGAEVNISSLTTRFSDPSITIKDIEVTNRSEPSENILQVGEVRLALLWDGLLRGKFVIPEASVLRIQVNSPRRTPGRVLPARQQAGGSGPIHQAAEATLTELREKNESNLLGNLLGLASGDKVKDQVADLQGALESRNFIKSLEKNIKEKKGQWQERLNTLASEEQLQSLVKKAEALKIDLSKPSEIKGQLKEAEELYRLGRKHLKAIEQASQDLKKDMTATSQEAQQIESLIKKDIDELASQLRLPSLDPQEVNKMLLGNLVADQIQDFVKLKQTAQEFMPEKKAARTSSREFTPRERAQGINHSFASGKSYPRIWLKKSEVSSQSRQGPTGDLSGRIENITDDPAHLGLPATLSFQGGFPRQDILGVEALITIDHTGKQPEQSGHFKLASYPVKEKELHRSKDLTLDITPSVGESQFHFQMKGSEIELNSISVFKDLEYKVEAHDKNVKRVLTDVVKDIDRLSLEVRANGTWREPRLFIKSNLGDRLVTALKGQVDAELRRARARLEAQVRKEIESQWAPVEAEIAQLESQLGGSLRSREQALKTLEKKIEEQKAKAKEQKNEQIDKLKEKARDLFKGF